MKTYLQLRGMLAEEPKKDNISWHYDDSNNLVITKNIRGKISFERYSPSEHTAGKQRARDLLKKHG